MKRVMCSVLLTALLAAAANSYAKTAEKIWSEFESSYPEAVMHRGLATAAEKPDMSKLAGFVVVMKGGIPAERAEFYIGWGEYDYRGVIIDGDKLKTHRGKIYTFLKPGDVMAVVDADRLTRTFYLKLISPDVYIPENRQTEKRHSRVTAMVGIKLPEEIYKSDDAAAAMEIITSWLKPFKNLDDAKTFASGMNVSKPE